MALLELCRGVLAIAFAELQIQERILAAQAGLRIQSDHDNIVLPCDRGLLLALGNVFGQARLLDRQGQALFGNHALDVPDVFDFRLRQSARLERNQRVGHPIAGDERSEHGVAPGLHGHEQPQPDAQRHGGPDRAPEIAR